MWGNVWENYVRQTHSDCGHMKLESIDANNSTLLQMSQGISWKDHNEVIYDDHQVLVFNHPVDSSIAAVTSLEDKYAEVKDESNINQFDTLLMKELSIDARENMDIMDVDLHDRKKEEMQMMHDNVVDSIKGGDRYLNPFMILDTDYDNYMVTYRCRQEFRKGRDNDFILDEAEEFRDVIEEFDENKHSQILAQKAIDKHGMSTRFLELQRNIEKNNAMDLSEDDLQVEIDLLMSVDPTHDMHFADRKPTIAMWKRIRHLYSQSATSVQISDEYDDSKEKWFNSLEIRLYMRNANDVQSDQINKLKKLVKEKVPGYDFDQFHIETLHDDKLCISGDVFKHINAKSWAQIPQIERPDKHTEQDLRSGKRRTGDIFDTDFGEGDNDLTDDELIDHETMDMYNDNDDNEDIEDLQFDESDELGENIATLDDGDMHEHEDDHKNSQHDEL